MPVIALLKDTPTLLVTKLQDLELSQNERQLSSAEKTQKKEINKKNLLRQKTVPAQCLMPPQPEAYIKYPRYDYL